MGLSSRTLNTLHKSAVRFLIGFGFVGMGLTVIAIRNLKNVVEGEDEVYEAANTKEGEETLKS